MDIVVVGLGGVSLLIFGLLWWQSRDPGKAIADTIENIERGTKALKEAHEAIEKIVKEYQEATKANKDKDGPDTLH